MSKTINDLVALERLSTSSSEVVVLRSLNKPEKMGNAADIAYGGCVLSMCVNAAFYGLPSATTSTPPFYLYSVLGTYVGPTLASDLVTFRVDVLRSTRTFQTRRVEARQKGRDGVERITFFAVCDFVAPEPTALKYSLQPAKTYTEPESLLPVQEAFRRRAEAGEFPMKVYEMWYVGFALARRMFEMRYCPEGASTANVLGMVKGVRHGGWGDHYTAQTCAFWVRSKTPTATTGVPRHNLQDSRGETSAALAFLLDAALAFMPATIGSTFLDDYGAISSLDASLRFHEPDDRAAVHPDSPYAGLPAEKRVKKALDLQRWLLIEHRTEVAGDGRTFSTARLFIRDYDVPVVEEGAREGSTEAGVGTGSSTADGGIPTTAGKSTSTSVGGEGVDSRYTHPYTGVQNVLPLNNTDHPHLYTTDNNKFRCLATMTQQSVMRPKPKQKAKAAKANGKPSARI
ncbi:hypothetical protein PYCC9005_005737 [Savitreella phatthalungensis]